MNEREIVLVTGIYLTVVLFIALVLLIGGADLEEYTASWNAGFALTGEGTSWEAST